MTSGVVVRGKTKTGSWDAGERLLALDSGKGARELDSGGIFVWLVFAEKCLYYRIPAKNFDSFFCLVVLHFSKTKCPLRIRKCSIKQNHAEHAAKYPRKPGRFGNSDKI